MFEIGPTLREERRRQGLEIEDLGARTKVRAKYLRFLEEERFDQLPGATYVKGFLRTYAEALGLDGRPFVDEYTSRYVALEDEGRTRREVPRSGSSRGRATRHTRRERRTVVAAITTVAVAMLVVFAAWRFGGEEMPSVPGLGVAAPESATIGETVTVVIEATGGATFVEARVGSRFGEQLYSGTLLEGARQTFRGASIYLAVERPQLVTVRVDGRQTQLATREVTFAAASGIG